MRLVKEFNLIENKKVILWLNIASLPLLVFFAVLFTALALSFGTFEANEFSLWTFLIIGASLLGLIVVHELIHGLFFKLFAPEGKEKFGFKNGMAYATSPHSFYNRPQFSWIVLAPFVLITLGLFLLNRIGWISGFSFVFLASFHAAACVGDFYWIYLVMRAPKNSYIEDTEKGINFYVKKN